MPATGPSLTPRIWQVGALCRAVADALDGRFNPVAVRGEVSGFARAPSGHCYFSLKDAQGQIRCVMFRRAASLLEFVPSDGELVQVQGRLGLYEPRGDLQLVAESLARVGQGELYEQFARLRARLEAEGLFDAARKRPIPTLPRAIGVVTSLGAAAWHDVVSALRRRAPHVRVVLAPAAVQGPQAPAELVEALESLYQRRGADAVDVVLLVRGGGSIEDLWAFNDEQLARTIVASPMPLICGVGHETDITIADWCADLRAPTPTAAAELAALPAQLLQGALRQLAERRGQAGRRCLDLNSQRLDLTGARLGRPSGLVAGQHRRLIQQAQRLRYGVLTGLQQQHARLKTLQASLPAQLHLRVARVQERLHRAQLGLGLLDPRLVLKRGYAWVTDAQGRTISDAQQLVPRQRLHLHLAQGEAAVDVVELQPGEQGCLPGTAKGPP